MFSMPEEFRECIPLHCGAGASDARTGASIFHDVRPKSPTD